MFKFGAGAGGDPRDGEESRHGPPDIRVANRGSLKYVTGANDDPFDEVKGIITDLISEFLST